jgi:hypothetical protein
MRSKDRKVNVTIKREGAAQLCAFSLVSLVSLTAAGCSTEFKGTNVSPSQPASPPTVSPKEDDAGKQPLPPEVCSDSHKAARLYFVVDNSNSHGYVVPGQELRSGTDPARLALSVRGVSELKTFRQEALYTIIKRTIELDVAAKKSTPEFLGTELGVSYFPRYRGDGNPSTRYQGELDDLGQYVNVTGSDGTAASVFPSRMTDLSSLRADFAAGSKFADDLWGGFAFTHTPGGSTPYATGLRAAVENLQPGSAARASDPRENIVIMLTDGLPTDETPSAIQAFKTQLGAATKVFIVSVYDPAEDPALTDSPFFNNLKQAFLGSANWATKPGNPDRYSKTNEGFSQYWGDLLAAPGKIANQIIKVSDASKLGAEVDKILQATTTCRSK